MMRAASRVGGVTTGRFEMKGLLRWLPLFLAVLMVPACGAQKKAAEQALSAAEAAYATISVQANNLAPDQAKEIEAAIADGKTKLAAGDIKGALSAAQDVQTHVKSLSEEFPTLQAKLDGDWKTLTVSVPGALAALDKKLQDFGRPPAGMPGRAGFDAASAKLSLLNTQWGEAKTLAEGGKLAQAVSLAEGVKDDAVQALTEMQTGS